MGCFINVWPYKSINHKRDRTKPGNFYRNNEIAGESIGRYQDIAACKEKILQGVFDGFKDSKIDLEVLLIKKVETN